MVVIFPFHSENPSLVTHWEWLNCDTRNIIVLILESNASRDNGQWHSLNVVVTFNGTDSLSHFTDVGRVSSRSYQVSHLPSPPQQLLLENLHCFPLRRIVESRTSTIHKTRLFHGPRRYECKLNFKPRSTMSIRKLPFLVPSVLVPQPNYQVVEIHVSRLNPSRCQIHPMFDRGSLAVRR